MNRYKFLYEIPPINEIHKIHIIQLILAENLIVATEKFFHDKEINTIVLRVDLVDLDL